MAAFRSRSIVKPQASHLNTRALRERLAFFVRHLEQSLELGNQEAASNSNEPYLGDL